MRVTWVKWDKTAVSSTGALSVCTLVLHTACYLHMCSDSCNFHSYNFTSLNIISQAVTLTAAPCRNIITFVLLIKKQMCRNWGLFKISPCVTNPILLPTNSGFFAHSALNLVPRLDFRAVQMKDKLIHKQKDLGYSIDTQSSLKKWTKNRVKMAMMANLHCNSCIYLVIKTWY